MSLSNLLNENNYDIYCNSITAENGIIDNLSVSLINGLPPPSAPPIGAPVNSILTVTSPGVASFTNNAVLNNVDVDGNFKFNNNSGLVNQFIKKTSSSDQDWQYISSSDVSPGLVGQVLITGGSSLGQWAYIDSGNFATAPVNTVLTSDSSGDVNFTKLPVADIVPGSNGQILTTTGGAASWNNFTIGTIPHGTAYQVVETDQTGNNVQWTSTLGINSITFTGNIANFQSVFNRYYTAPVQLPLYAVTQGGSPSIYQNIDVDGYFSVIGKRVELTIFPFTLSSLFGGAVAPCYLAFLIGPSFLRAANLLGIGNEGQRQSTCMCCISQNTTTQQEPAYANMYYQYYSTTTCYLELTKGNAGNFVANSYHGEPFVTAGIEFMELKAPFTISYIGQ